MWRTEAVQQGENIGSRFTVRYFGPPLAIDAFSRLNEGTKHGIDARLVASAVRLEPFEDIAIQADMNVLLCRRQANRHPALPVVGQRPFVPVRQPFEFRARHGLDPLPVGPALAVRKFSSDLCQPKSAKYFRSSASLALLNEISRMAFVRSVHTTAKNFPANQPTVTKRSSPCLGDGYAYTGRPSNNRVASIKSRPCTRKFIVRLFSSHSKSIKSCIHKYVHSQETRRDERRAIGISVASKCA